MLNDKQIEFLAEGKSALAGNFPDDDASECAHNLVNGICTNDNCGFNDNLERNKTALEEFKKITDKQIKYIFWRMETKAQEPVSVDYQIKDAQGIVKNVHEEKSKTMEMILNNLPAENKYGYFYQAMQCATAEQASYLIKLLDTFKYQKFVKILRELKIITN